jgi:hypothetical protein
MLPFFMRYLSVLILRPDKKTEWVTIPWGKYHLDLLRKSGNLILFSKEI